MKKLLAIVLLTLVSLTALSADKLVPSPSDTGAIRRFVDMGDGTWAEMIVTGGASAAGAAGLPVGATAVAQSTTTSNATAVATLPAAAGKTTYVTHITISGLAPTGAGGVGHNVTGVLGGAISYYMGLPAGPAPVPVIDITFNPPLPASAPNTAIVLTGNAFGAGSGGQNSTIQGFQK